MSAPTVRLAKGDQCQYGAEAQRGSGKGSPVLKPSGFLTNSNAVAEVLSRRCTGAQASAHGLEEELTCHALAFALKMQHDTHEGYAEP